MTALARPRLAVAVLPLGLLLSLGCNRDNTPDTGIIVEVTSDLQPGEITQVHLTTKDSQGNPIYDHTFALGEGQDRVRLPFRVGLYPLHDTSAPIHIEAVGQLNTDSQPVVSRSATLSFVPRKKIVLVLPLLAVCRPADCKVANSTCMADGNCASDAAESSKLPPYVPNQPVSAGTGGTTATGGMTGGAGTTSAGGTGTAGVLGGTGGEAAGGTATGGSATIGGATSTGGALISGGTTTSGGTTASGGTSSAGGTTTAGGTTASGGTTSAGGTKTAGGTTASGGTSSAGGTKTAGGTTANGGTSSAGGTTTSGGTTASAGASGSGGTAGATPPSCSGLAATCGPSGNESCCTSLLVPGNLPAEIFYRSYDGVTFTDKSYPATVADFYLDKYEITVGRFRQFVNAGMGMGTQASPPASGAGVHPLIPGSGWNSAWNASLQANTDALKTAMKCDSTHQTWTDTAGSNESRPQNCINWYEAFAFCAWDGGRLATEAEWNYAAAGGSEQRAYPWSNPPTSRAIDDSYAVYCGGSCSSTQNVGSKSPKGDGKWGHSDLAGNVWEWTLDWYVSPYQTPCNNCADLIDASYRVVRGGGFGFGNLASSLPSAYRNYGGPGNHDYTVGARCARTSL